MDPDALLDDLNRATRELADLAEDSEEAERLREEVDQAIEHLELCSRLMDAGIAPEAVSRAEEVGLLSADDEDELESYVADLAKHRA